MSKMWRMIFTASVLCIICIIYLLYTAHFNVGLFTSTPDAGYNLLLDAFLHGRVNVLTNHTFDLSFYQNKWYLNWGPAPVLFILPFYLIAGKAVSDIFYSVVAGMANVFLFYAVLFQVKKYFRLQLSLFSELFLLLGFSFCSANFYLSFTGHLWVITAVEQLIATFYLLLCYLFYFLFLNHKKRLILLILSVVFFNLAWLSRYSLLFQLLIFGYLFFVKELSFTRKRIKVGLMVGGITLFFGCCLLFYNYLKFQNPFETGLRYQNAAHAYRQIYKERKFFSVSYISQNVYYYFLHLPSVTYFYKNPLLNADLKGNSIFVFYPSLFLLFLFVKKRYYADKKRKVFMLFSGAIIFLTLSFLMCYFATGWLQFGNRFFLDVAPLAYLLIAFVIQDVPLPVTVGLLMYELAINYLGILSLSYFFYTHLH